MSLLLVAASFLAASLLKAADEKKPFKLEGAFIDGCSCDAPCPCELTGLAHGCEGVGAMVLTSGSFAGQDFGEASIAYGTVPGKWVRLYLDVKKATDRVAVEAFARSAFAAFGKIEEVRNAAIALTGESGNYTLTVDSGKVMTLKTEAVLGGDKKKPIAISNTQNPFVSVFLQGKTVSGVYHDGGQEFKLKDSNAYFQDKVKAKGEL
jgi:hypothetical protein